MTIFKRNLLCTFALVAVLFFTATLKSEGQVILDSQNKVTISLRSGDIITLYGRAKTRDQSFSSEYYYLPANLGLTKKPDGVPEFLFAKYTTEERADNGGVQGAILHALFQWGLTPEMEREAEQSLRQELTKLKESGNPLYNRVSPENATINGAVSLKTGESNFQIISATLQGENRIVSSSAPVLPGSKVAIAAKMDKNEAQLLASTFEKGRSITDLSVSIAFKYDVLFPAVDGEIVFDWERLDSLSQTDSIKNEVKTRRKKEFSARGFLWFAGWKYSNKEVIDRIDRSEASTFYREMIENKVVSIDIDKNVDDEIANEITNQFMTLFMQSLADASPKPPERGEEEDPIDTSAQDQYDQGISWTLNTNKIRQTIEKRFERYNLRLRVPITMEGSITENLATFYDQVRDNSNCVYSVNLNDPFFQHRDIQMIVDLDAADVFNDEINYVTVDVRKRRSSGNDFQDQVTIDKKYIDENGLRAALTYARGEDRNPDLYEYKTQWSIRGGNVYPENPTWQRGEWEGITLAVPLVARTIDFEGDLEELDSLDVARATLQLRYVKFGKEFEKNLHISKAKGEALVSGRIFTDSDTPGYMYRLILNHKEKGKMALAWQAKTVNDNYVYANIPNELKNEQKEFLKRVLDAAKDMNAETNSDGSVKKGKGVMGKIADFLGKLIK